MGEDSVRDGDSAALRAEVLQLRRELAELERAAEISTVLFEHSSDAHLIFDARGIIDCNNAAIAMLRCEDKAQVLRLHPAELSPELQPDGRRSLEKSVEMDRTAHERGHHRFEWTHRRMTGEDFPVEVTLTPVELSSGPALLVVWHELTALRAREAALREQVAVIRSQQAAIERLTMPVIEVWDGVLMVPVLGALDHALAASLTTPVLEAIARSGARALLVDLTGLTQADRSTARHLGRLLASAQLLGAEGIVVGIRPAVAQALLEVEGGLPRVRTMRTLREALERCMRGQ